ncbi:MAG: TRAP transporter small permease subunit [Alphaproteobacteria bacterium]|nr:TRAP transporter small permease subunit [Alphaproteobacteria bacterium]
MPSAVRTYVRLVDSVNRYVGRAMMYGIFVMMAILLWSSISKTFFLPSLWTLEMAQFAMVAYYILGGPYSIQLGSNVRMDLLYGEWSPTRKAWFDAVTICFLIFYLGVLLYGGISSTSYSLEYGERSATAWRPYMWPIKIIMCIGIFLMLLQAVAEFFKDIARIRGVELAATSGSRPSTEDRS